MFAVHVTARIDPLRAQEARDDLGASIVPRVKSAPGFVRGTWFGNDESGHSVVLFDSEEHAKESTKMVATPPGGPVQIESMKVYEVHAEA